MLVNLLRSRKKIARLSRARLELESLENRWVPSSTATAYLATDLVADEPGIAPVTDPHLINAWGIAVNPTGAFWVSSGGADLSALYSGDVSGSPLIKVPLEVAIPGGKPTGQVFNNTSDFEITDGTTSAPAFFIFASESGAVTGWNPTVPPSTSADVGFQSSGSGNFLYLADFHNAKVDVLDSTFHLTHLDGSFADPNMPTGYAPFNITALNGKLYVSYAKQDADAEDDVAGHGHGFIDVFDLNGHFQQRLVSRGVLNSPWGMVIAPAGFGDFSGQLLVGNFGNGRINAFDPTTGAFKGTLSESPGHPVVIDGLWGLAFGNGVAAGSSKTLYYGAGPDDETHGLFGKITANAAGTNSVTATQTGGDLTITGSRDDDRVFVELTHHGQQVVVRSGGKLIGTFDLASLSTIEFNGLAGNDQILVNNRIKVTTIIDGGAGDDHLFGGGGNSILLGGSGSDHLFGQGGRDILIGGDSRDFLNGGSNDDLMIGGSTTHDANPPELLQILAEWTSIDSYATRIDKLRSGTDGLPKLDATTVLDDGARDILNGGFGLDWFLSAPNDLLRDKLPAEQVN
jgi:uncharacterized protein (TIGR03118 family)